MKPGNQTAYTLTLLFGLALPVRAAIIVDDTWADGSRKEQKLPAESAWFSSQPTNLAATPGTLTAYSASSSRQYITYFPVSEKAVSLGNVGEAITATLWFKPWGVGEQNPS